MTKPSPRIVYMGTPDFAVEPLKMLLENEYNIVGVVTAPDKPAGRGKKISESAVKQFAVSRGLKVLQPEKLKAPEFIKELQSLDTDLQIVVAFRMLPEIVWSMPKMGTFNLHASLLPQYRGAAPINWAVINGEEKTGVTTFFIEKEIDTGNILLQKEIKILTEDNAGTIHDKLMYSGAELVVETVKGILENSIKPKHQDNLIDNSVELKPAPKIFKEDCKIDWNQPAQRIQDFIRGLSPYPAAFFEVTDIQNMKLNIKVFKTEIVPSPSPTQHSTIKTDNKTYIHIGCNNGYLNIIELQFPGKKRMKVEDFLRGYKDFGSLVLN